MTKITVAGTSYEVSDDPALAVGVPMDEGHVRALQNVRAATLRNRFTQNLKGKENIDSNAVQADINAAAEAFKFGVSMRGKGGGRRIADPVEKKALSLAIETIAAAYKARFGVAAPASEVRENAVQLLATPRGDDFRKRAKAALREQAAAGSDVLDMLGLSEPKAAEAA